MENSAGFMSSGTSLEPLTTSETAAMIHKTWDGWTFMFHANAELVSVQQSGPRGRDKVFSPNWVMPMLGSSFGRQSIEFRTMLSAEPMTVTKRRYPELFQNGETAYGLPVIDGQHPHDLIMELAARYEVNVAEKTRLFVYGAPVGEPALGPTAFPHRASNSENPLSVLGHHVEDSTHISNSVVTVGFIQGPLQLEASTFHGQEPNENRWNIDRGKPDSFVSRLDYLPHQEFFRGSFRLAGSTIARHCMSRKTHSNDGIHPSSCDIFRRTYCDQRHLGGEIRICPAMKHREFSTHTIWNRPSSSVRRTGFGGALKISIAIRLFSWEKHRQSWMSKRRRSAGFRLGPSDTKGKFHRRSVS